MAESLAAGRPRPSGTPCGILRTPHEDADAKTAGLPGNETLVDPKRITIERTSRRKEEAEKDVEDGSKEEEAEEAEGGWE
eukprot:5208784-Pyramimonas_sp.AAC.2